LGSQTTDTNAAPPLPLQGFEPCFPGHALPLEALREYVIVNAINAYFAVVHSPPYDILLNRSFQGLLQTVFKCVQDLGVNKAGARRSFYGK
jgi:hypothetical protein